MTDYQEPYIEPERPKLTIPDRFRQPAIDTTAMEKTVREEIQQHHADQQADTDHKNERRADAINAMLRARGVEFVMTPKDAERVWWIAETLLT
jgi:hypothetical protein